MRDGWTETTLGDVVELGKGGAWGADEMEPNRVEAICLRGTDLADLIDKKHPEAPVRWLTPTELKKAVCAPNMVLIETSGSKCGRSVVLTSEMLSGFALPVVYSNFCRTLRIDTRLLSSRYVEMWFSHMYEVGVIPSYRATSAMPNLDVKSLLRMETIAVPPLAEQKRIVDVVSSVDNYIDVMQQQVDTARTARKAVLHSICDAITSKFPLVDLNKKAEITDCEHKTAPETVIEHFYGFSIGTRDIRNGRILYHQAKKVSRDTFDSWSKRRLLKQGDLIYSREAPVGQIGYVDGSFPVCLGQRTVAISTKPVVLDSKFLSYWLDGTTVVNWISARSVGITVAHLNVADIKNIPIPDGITLGEQEDVVLLLSSMDDVIQSTEQAVVDAKNLRSGLLSDLLSGEHEIPASYDSLLGAA